MKAAVITLLLNAWFINTLVDYYLSYDLIVKTSVNELWTSAISFKQLFSLDMLSYDDNGVSVVLIRSPGIPLLIIIILTVFAFATKKIRRDKKWIVALSVFSLLSTFMVLDSFPYTFISEHLPLVYKIISSVQYAMRYNIFATLFLSILGVLIVMNLADWNKKIARGLMLGVSVLVIILWGVLTYQYVGNATHEATIGGAYYGTYTWDRQYLLSDTDREQTKNFDLYASEGVQITEDSREDGTYKYYIDNPSATEGYADLDILMYKGYKDYTDDGNELDLDFGTNNRVRVTIPGGFNGNVTISFYEPIYWRIAECISLLSMISCVIAVVKIFRKKEV